MWLGDKATVKREQSEAKMWRWLGSVARAARNVRWGRSWTSYARVQALIGTYRRNRSFQIRSSRVHGKTYLNVGCGANTQPVFLNLDYTWHPGIDLCWDIRQGIPLASGSMQGIFSEHCLEHFSLPTVRFVLKEFRRLLQPSGTLRLVLPDAGLYLGLYAQRVAGEISPPFPYEDADRRCGLRSPLVSVNRLFYLDRDSSAGHRCMFDADLLAELLVEAGFQEVECCTFRRGRDPRLLIDSETRQIESLYCEATI